VINVFPVLVWFLLFYWKQVKSGILENIIVLASHWIINELWIFLSRIYRKKVALSIDQ